MTRVMQDSLSGPLVGDESVGYDFRERYRLMKTMTYCEMIEEEQFSISPIISSDDEMIYEIDEMKTKRFPSIQPNGRIIFSCDLIPIGKIEEKGRYMIKDEKRGMTLGMIEIDEPCEISMKLNENEYLIRMERNRYEHHLEARKTMQRNVTEDMERHSNQKETSCVVSHEIEKRHVKVNGKEMEMETVKMTKKSEIMKVDMSHPCSYSQGVRELSAIKEMFSSDSKLKKLKMKMNDDKKNYPRAHIKEVNNYITYLTKVYVNDVEAMEKHWNGYLEETKEMQKDKK